MLFLSPFAASPATLLSWQIHHPLKFWIDSGWIACLLPPRDLPI